MSSPNLSGTIREEVQPIMKRSIETRSVLGSRVARVLPTSRLSGVAQLIDTWSRVDLSADLFDVTRPIGFDSPIPRLRETFEQVQFDQRRYPAGAEFIADEIRDEWEDQGQPIETVVATRLGARAAAVWDILTGIHLTTSGNYAATPTALGNIATDEDLKLGNAINAKMEALVDNGGMVDTVVMNLPAANRLARQLDVRQSTNAIATDATNGLSASGHVNKSQLANWLRSEFGLELLVVGDPATGQGKYVNAAGNAVWYVQGYMSFIATGRNDVDFVRTAVKRTSDLPVGDTTIATVRSRRTENPDGEEWYASPLFGLFTPAASGDDSPHGFALTYTGVS